MNLISIKENVFGVIAAAGGVLSVAFGGCDKLFIALLVIMVADYLSGMVVACIFKNSPKTETGAAESKAGFIGLVKKGMMLLFIVVAYQADIVLGANGLIRNAMIMGFLANEILSIIENAGLMGIKLPNVLINAVDMLKKNSDINIENKDEKGDK